MVFVCFARLGVFASLRETTFPLIGFYAKAPSRKEEPQSKRFLPRESVHAALIISNETIISNDAMPQNNDAAPCIHDGLMRNLNAPVMNDDASVIRYDASIGG